MKKMKWLFMLVALAALVFAMAACSSSDKGSEAPSAGNNAPSEEEPAVKKDAIHIKFGHTLSETSSWQKGALYFKQRVEELTDGRYTVDIFPNGQLSSGDQTKALEMLRQGTYDVDITSALIWSNLDERINITAMPWILPSIDYAEEMLQGEPGEMLLDILRENGVTPVAIGETGYRQIFTNKRQITSPDDLKDMKIRVPGTKMFIDLYKELGADPTAMNFTEVFTALQQGTIDGMEGVVDVVVSSRFHEVLDYLSVNNYNFDIFYLTFSNKFYESLSDEDKELIMQAGKEATQHATEYSRKANEEALELLKNELEVAELTEEQIEVFKQAAAPIYEMYKDTFPEELRQAFNYIE